MSKLKLDWVEIPAGEFQIGIPLEKIKQQFSEALHFDNQEDQHYFNQQLMPRIELIYEGVDVEDNPDYSVVDQEFLEKYKALHINWLRLARMQQLRPVNLNTFYITRYPLVPDNLNTFFKSVTNVKLPMTRNPYTNEPADVWYETALAVAEWANALLPTEYQWEKAARGTDGRLYPWGDEWDTTRGNFVDSLQAVGRPIGNSNQRPHLKTPVDGYPTGVSPYDIFDMAGNVREWTHTIKPLSYLPNMSYPVLKGNMVLTKKPPAGALASAGPVQLNSGEPLWLNNLVARSQQMNPALYPIYTGMRLVKEKWDNNTWTGI